MWTEVPGTPGDPMYAIHLLDFNDSATPGYVNASQNLQPWYDNAQFDGGYSFGSVIISGNAPWLGVASRSDGTLGVSVSSGSLGPGSYLGYIYLNTDNPNVKVADIAVRLTIAPRPGAPPLYSTDHDTIPVSQPQGSTTNVTSNFALTYVDGRGTQQTTSGKILVLDGPLYGFWVSCVAGANPVGPQPNSITCTSNATGLPAGTYYAYATFTDSGQTTAVTRELSLTITPGASSDANSSDYVITYAAGSPLASQSIFLSDPQGIVQYLASADVDWLDIGGAVGRTPGSITLSPRPSRIVPVQPNQRPQSLTGHVTIKAVGNSSDQLTLNVQLNVQPSATVQSPQIFPSATQLILSSGSTPSAVLTVKSTGANFPLNARALVLTPSGGKWLSVSTSSANTPASVNVNTVTAQLPAGKYVGYVVLSSPQPGVATVNVPVLFTYSPALFLRIESLIGVTGPDISNLTVSPQLLSFSTDPNAGLPNSQLLQFSVQNFPPLVFLDPQTFDGHNWLAVTPNQSGTSDFPLVSIQNTANMPSGVYTGIVQVVYNGNVVDGAVVSLTIP